MTSNVGARKLADFGTGIGFSTSSSMLEEQAKMDSIIKKELKNKFSPEFLNRLDDIVLFDQLKSEDVIRIVDIELNKFIARMGRQDYTFKFNKNAKEFLAKEGYDQAYGARPIKRAIQKYVEDAVADAILDGLLEEGKTYTVSKDKQEDKLIIK
jgi:ATP-dependent Clp protease ATP-binding subunit ClpC